ncbi:MAG: BMP family ABC transporter substrate-binding protein [Lachnospiraceae bacterium]|nr:BMP family ABC transporter substrate-binding protein [Lachnospiraceae bacterium]
MKNKEKLFRAALIAFSLIVVAVIGLIIRNFQVEVDKTTTVAGGIFIGSLDDQGWNESHYDGISSACDNLSCPLFTRENVPEEEEAVKKAVKELAGLGSRVIFLTSYGYGNGRTKLSGNIPRWPFILFPEEEKRKTALRISRECIR